MVMIASRLIIAIRPMTGLSSFLEHSPRWICRFAWRQTRSLHHAPPKGPRTENPRRYNQLLNSSTSGLWPATAAANICQKTINVRAVTQSRLHECQKGCHRSSRPGQCQAIKIGHPQKCKTPR
jgi:hypothetical protein